MTGRDWRAMTRAEFDTGAPPDTLFDLAPGTVPVTPDGCGTGDLLATLEEGP